MNIQFLSIEFTIVYVDYILTKVVPNVRAYFPFVFVQKRIKDGYPVSV